MAVLKKIRENFGDVSKGAVAGAMMLGAVAMPFASASAADGKVQYKDIRAKSEGYVRMAGHAASGKNRIALMVKGGNNNLLKILYVAAKNVENNTDKDVWFLHSVDDKPNDGNTEVDIYVSGRKTGTLVIAPTLEKDADKMLSLVVGDGLRQIKETASVDGTKQKPVAANDPSNDKS